MRYKDKIVLITGSGSGIGKAAAIAFSKEGGELVVSDINEVNGLETVLEIKNSGGKASFFKADVSNHNMVKKLMDYIVEKHGRLDVAINNAGIGGDLAKVTDQTIESWNKTMSVNSSGVFYCVKQGGGVILNTSSIAGIRGLPNATAYSASKHAVVGITKTVAMEYAKNNIRVNAICPVFTVTPMFDPEAMDKLKSGISEKLKANIPMKRFADVMEQVNSMLWLCSNEASFITGQAISVDGGITA
ncbi:SDR family oxidoreductase [Flavobacteriaceae bacterium]|nr:SDR family oxidoreductase [Flavobacteriaceae bacterium]